MRVEFCALSHLSSGFHSGTLLLIVDLILHVPERCLAFFYSAVPSALLSNLHSPRGGFQ